MVLKVGFLLVGLMATFLLAAGTLFHFTGVLVVNVKDKDHHIYLPVPMLLVRGAIRMIPEKAQAQIHAPDELRQNRAAILAAAKALVNCPDGNFVEVESRDQTVEITKKNGNLYVDVTSPQEEVHLQVPIEATGATLADLSQFARN